MTKSIWHENKSTTETYKIQLAIRDYIRGEYARSGIRIRVCV